MNKTKSIECHCGSQIRNVHVKKYKCKSLKCSSNIGCYYTFDVGLENNSTQNLEYGCLEKEKELKYMEHFMPTDSTKLFYSECWPVELPSRYSMCCEKKFCNRVPTLEFLHGKLCKNRRKKSLSTSGLNCGETLSGPTIKEKKPSFSKKETKVNYILQGSQSWWENPGLVVLVVVCVVVVIGIVMASYFIKRKIKRKKLQSNRELTTNENGLPSEREIHKKITYTSKNCIYNGNFAKVYKAVYNNNEVAVKVFARKNFEMWQRENTIYGKMTQHTHMLNFIAADIGKL